MKFFQPVRHKSRNLQTNRVRPDVNSGEGWHSATVYRLIGRSGDRDRREGDKTGGYQKPAIGPGWNLSGCRGPGRDYLRFAGFRRRRFLAQALDGTQRGEQGLRGATESGPT